MTKQTSPNLATRPANKVYTDTQGHERIVRPVWSVWTQEWDFLYAFAYCTEMCDQH